MVWKQLLMFLCLLYWQNIWWFKTIIDGLKTIIDGLKTIIDGLKTIIDGLKTIIDVPLYTILAEYFMVWKQ